MNNISNRPDPNAAFPNANLPRLCFIKNVVKNPRIIIGDYIDKHFGDIAGKSSVIESRQEDSDCTIANLKENNRHCRSFIDISWRMRKLRSTNRD